MDTIFIQFYHNLLDNTLLLQNGFSYVWNEAHPLWIDSDTEDLPVKSKKIYVSALTSFITWKVWGWAEKNPDIEFVVGGPAVWPGCAFRKLLKPFPSNLRLIEGFAESIFNRPVNLKSWRLILPKSSKPVTYTYHIDDTCEWSKCVFCRRLNTKPHEVRKYDLEPLWNAPAGTVYLVADTLRTRYLPILKELNYSDKQYRMHIRGTHEVYEMLKKVLPRVKRPESLMFCIGVEFPSDRMLQWMNKGTTVKELVEVILLLAEYGCQFRLSYITDWPNLTKEDIDNAKEFFTSLRNCDSILGSHFISFLTVVGEPLEKYMGEEVTLGCFVVGYKTNLTDEEKLLNREWEKIIASRNNVSFYFGKERILK